MIQVDNNNGARGTLPLFIASLFLALAGAVFIGSRMLNLSITDIEQLVIIMGGNGLLTTLVSYGFYRFGIIQWFRSLRWTLMVTIILAVALVMLNIWVLAQLMFIDRHYFTLTTTMLVFAGLTSVSLSIFISRALTDRLCRLSTAAYRLAEGDLSIRLEGKGNDEIAYLIQSFNTMAQHLQEVDDQKRALEKTRRDLIAWVSHDLRTPITSMRVMLEAMADGVVNDQETQQRYLNTTLSEIAHLSRLIDDLFEMAQLDVGHLDLDMQPASIRDLVSDTLSAMQPKANARDIILTGQVDEGVDLVRMAPDKIQRVLYNLTENALRYTPPGERVSIHVTRGEQVIDVRVNNTGVTIPQDKLPLIFHSFYRGEESRAQTAEGERGVGLGLAIARGFVEAHGGTIGVESSVAQGTTFHFTLPDKNAAG